MEIKEETMGSNYSGTGVGGGAIAAFAKGKRTKRQRPGPAVADSSSGSSAASASVITEEDEDMANCLILLARGRCAAPAATDQHPPPPPPATAVAAAAGVAGVYECKTCSKCFPSFQALGGHRASHKKLKHAAALANAYELAETNKKPPGHDEEPVQVVRPTVGAVKSSRVHECSICGSEFNSGQALGGHMRRHRPLIAVAAPEEPKSERTSVLELDLNLPAPAEDGDGDNDDDDQSLDLVHRGFAFGAAAAKRPLIFSSSGSALVDCHY